MWVAKLSRAIAGLIKGNHKEDERDHKEIVESHLQLISSDLSKCEEHLSTLASQESSEDKGGTLSEQDYLNLRIQEYVALRSEQRTRLDAANRLIHYNVLVLGAVLAGLVASYKSGQVDDFNNTLRTALLLLPLLSMPFAFTQWNDEIIIDSIGEYLEKMKTEVTPEQELRLKYWNWERFHTLEKPLDMTITAVIRTGFFTIFASSSLLAFHFYGFTSSSPISIIPIDLDKPGGKIKLALLILDWMLLIVALITSGLMIRRRNRRKKNYQN